MNSNASASAFGWDFQRNAAIFLMLKNIKIADSVRVEGKTEDIEITLSDKQKIYAQAKSVFDPNDYSNVLTKVKEALKTLNSAANKKDYDSLIYITNSPNPFNQRETMHMFSGLTQLGFNELSDSCRKIVDARLMILKTKNFDTSKLKICVIPFYGDNDENRYKHIREAVNEFLSTIKLSDRWYAPKLLESWKNGFFENGTKKNTEIVIKKSDMIWPIIVLLSEVCNYNDIYCNLDDGDIEEIEVKYKTLISNKSEKFEFITQVITDYQKRKTEKTVSNEKDFVNKFWDTYSNQFDFEGLDANLKEPLVKIIINKIIINKYNINRIKTEVRLC